MNYHDIAEIAIVIASILVISPLLAAYLEAVFGGKRHPLSFLEPAEAAFYRLARLDRGEMDWKTYAFSVLALGLVSIIVLAGILMGQAFLPLNPRHFAGMRWDLALNTAISFVTNTNWQSYAGESSLSYFSQAVGLAVQNFLSAAVGIAIAVAVVRGIVSRGQAGLGEKATIGNFWVDTTKSVLYLLLPLSIVVALILASQGVVQSLGNYVGFHGLAGAAGAAGPTGDGVIPLGPAASQVAIKQLGSNGGGFFGQNSAHPFENPTPFSNIVELISIILIPAALPLLFGRMAGKRRQGRLLFAVMFLLFAVGLVAAIGTELRWGSLEGKELRFGISNSTLWAVTTTVTSNGSVNAMHDSLSPLAGMIPLINIMLGEVVFGGVGSGLYGMFALVFIAVFIAGLMVGRGPEYLGKKIEAREVQLSMVAIIAPNLVILLFAAIAASLPVAIASLGNPGAHGLSEILYAFASAAGNNGSAFAGLTTNTYFFNLMQGAGMLIGRYGVIVPILGAAGSLAGKKTIPESAGTFRTDSLVFGVLLFFVILIVAGLTHFPALSLGPILDHLGMVAAVK
ncbi:MAG TPA: potassium-transporting ATPase subunit KdpA [Rectinemataceae bacterium]|nr:potassium-transporting ATPase subunit KdpA [Rectinemataceae bacterium]